jgi:hypothetical protein
MCFATLLRRFDSPALSIASARLRNLFLSNLCLKGTSNSPRRQQG